MQLESGTVTVSEEDGTATLTVALDSINPFAPVVIGYQTADDSAQAGSDFTGTSSGSVTIPAGASSAALTIPLVNDTAAEASEIFSVMLTAVAGGQISGTQTAQVTITDADIGTNPPPNNSVIYLPLVANMQADTSVTQAPDLVVDSINIVGPQISVVIRNAGNQAAVSPFWVDLIVNPSTPPTQVNDTAERLFANGLVWGVQGANIPLAAGETLTLTVNGPHFNSDYSTLNGTISAGSTVYAHVDSASITTTYGAVEETHEVEGTAYNNIERITVSADIALVIQEEVGSNGRQHSSLMPNRP